jgi:hypothetical protein
MNSSSPQCVEGAASPRPPSASHPLVSYFLIAFTRKLLFSVLLSKDGVSPALARLIASASLLGPSVAAFIVKGAPKVGRAQAACCIGSCDGGLACGGTCSSS